MAKSKARAFFVDRFCHPQTIAVIRTRALPLGIEIIVDDGRTTLSRKVFRRDLPVSGQLRPCAGFHVEIASTCMPPRRLPCVATDLLALCLLKEPGAMGADIAVGSSQRFGVPMGYGGPHAAFMACKDAHEARRCRGGSSACRSTRNGGKAYRLSLQTREQHIRREKATSNVCTAQALAGGDGQSFYAVFHGPKGLRAIAERVHFLTQRLARALEGGGGEGQPKSVLRHDHGRGGRRPGRHPCGRARMRG